VFIDVARDLARWFFGEGLTEIALANAAKFVRKGLPAVTRTVVLTKRRCGFRIIRISSQTRFDEHRGAIY
jgi:hypothetical protein